MTGVIRIPDGRLVSLGAELAGVVSAGVAVVEGVTVGPGDVIGPERDRLSQDYRQRWSGYKPSDIEPLGEARRLYHAVGIQPTRHRPSSEALLRRVLKGQDLYAINNIVDACNLASLSFLLPIGLYDLSNVVGSVVLRLGHEGEEYPGIRKGPVHLEGRLGLFDDEGPFGSPTSDSARTSVGDQTRNLLAVVMATANFSRSTLSHNTETLAAALAKYGLGRVTHTAILNTMKDY